jgi:Na+/H+-dicarboxylate symporter
MGRTATNVIGNSIATAAIAKWEGKRVARLERRAAMNAPSFGQLESEAK